MPSFGLDSIEIAEAIVTHRNEENDMNGEYCIIKTDIGHGYEIDASEIDFLYMPSDDFLEEACKELGMKFNKSEWKQAYGAIDEVVIVRNSERKE